MAKFLIFTFSVLLSFSCFARDLDKLYEKVRVKLGDREIEVYLADTEKRRADGLMFVTQLPSDRGMLFVFDREERHSFWMKNTMIPLAIGFINAQGELVDVQEMTPAKSMLTLDIPTYQSRRPARFALEMNKGWFSKQKIKSGAKLRPLSKALADSLGLPTSGSSK